MDNRKEETKGSKDGNIDVNVGELTHEKMTIELKEINKWDDEVINNNNVNTKKLSNSEMRALNKQIDNVMGNSTNRNVNTTRTPELIYSELHIDKIVKIVKKVITTNETSLTNSWKTFTDSLNDSIKTFELMKERHSLDIVNSVVSRIRFVPSLVGYDQDHEYDIIRETASDSKKVSLLFVMAMIVTVIFTFSILTTLLYFVVVYLSPYPEIMVWAVFLIIVTGGVLLTIITISNYVFVSLCVKNMKFKRVKYSKINSQAIVDTMEWDRI